jgi:Phosphodiester glycosidase
MGRVLNTVVVVALVSVVGCDSCASAVRAETPPPVTAAVAAPTPVPPAWQPVVVGVERQESHLGESAVIAYRVLLDRFAPHVVSFTTPTRISDAAPTGDYLAINASFFDEKQQAMGLVVDDTGTHGRALSKWGALRVDDAAARVLAPGAIEATATTKALVQGIPRLIVDGAIVEGLVAQTAIRTAVCVSPAMMTLVVTASAVEANAFATHLRDVIQCRDALNLDGGPSTQLSVRLGNHAERRDGGWGVPNMIVLLPKR